MPFWLSFTWSQHLALWCLPIALCLALVSFGCKSTTPTTPSNRLASIIIKDRTPSEIEAAIRTVFEKHDFEISRRREGSAMVFEKQGTFMNGLVYGDWYSGGVWDRVKIFLSQLAPGSIMVDCDAYMVQEHDDPFFQSERKPYKSRRHLYQNLLNEVDAELKRH